MLETENERVDESKSSDRSRESIARDSPYSTVALSSKVVQQTVPAFTAENQRVPVTCDSSAHLRIRLPSLCGTAGRATPESAVTRSSDTEISTERLNSEMTD
jgi:hypothetical protein